MSEFGSPEVSAWLALCARSLVAAGVCALIFAGCRHAIRLDTIAGRVLSLGVCLRLFAYAALFFISYFDLPFLRELHTGDGFWRLAPDARLYYDLALRILQDGFTVSLEAAPSPGFVHVLSAWMWAVGPGPAAAALLNVCCYVGACLLVMKVLGGDAQAMQLLVSAFTFSPALIVFGAQPLKDMVFVGIVVALCAIVRLTTAHASGLGRRSLIWLDGAALAVGFFVLSRIRPYYAVFLLAALAMAMPFAVYAARPRSLRTFVRRTAILGMIAAAVLIGMSGDGRAVLQRYSGVTWTSLQSAPPSHSRHGHEEREIGSGAAANEVDAGGNFINVDPYLADYTAWRWQTNTGTFQAVSDAPGGSRTARNPTDHFSFLHENRYYTIDPSRQYRVKFWARSVGSVAGGVLYFCLRQYKDSEGTTCDYNAGRGPYDPSPAYDLSTTWTEFTSYWGAGTSNPFQDAATCGGNGPAFAQIDWLMNYPHPVSGRMAGTMEIAFPRLEVNDGTWPPLMLLALDGARSAFVASGGRTNFGRQTAPPGGLGRLEAVLRGAAAMTIPIFVLRPLGVVDVGPTTGFLAIAELDTVFNAGVVVALGIVLWRGRARCRRHAGYLAFVGVIVVLTGVGLAYVVTNFGTLFRLRLMVMVPLWMTLLAVQETPLHLRLSQRTSAASPEEGTPEPR